MVFVCYTSWPMEYKHEELTSAQIWVKNTCVKLFAHCHEEFLNVPIK